MARGLVESLAEKFRPESYVDEYRAALEELIERKMRGEKRNARRRKSEPKVIDLMKALQASVAEAKQGDAATTRRSGRKKAAKRSRSAA